MDTAARGTLRIVAGQLAAVVGTLSLGLAVHAWGTAGTRVDPRTTVWAATGALVVAGVVVGARVRRRRRRQLYLAGVALAVASLATFFLWHLGGHEDLYAGGTADLHGVGGVAFVVEHLASASLVEQTLLATQLLLAVALATLWVWER